MPRFEQRLKGGPTVRRGTADRFNRPGQLVEEAPEVLLDRAGAHLETIARAIVPGLLDLARAALLKAADHADQNRRGGQGEQSRPHGPADPWRVVERHDTARGRAHDQDPSTRLRQQRKSLRHVAAVDAQDQPFENKQEGAGHRFTSARESRGCTRRDPPVRG